MLELRRFIADCFVIAASLVRPYASNADINFHNHMDDGRCV